jgi:hypothetical protein
MTPTSIVYTLLYNPPTHLVPSLHFSKYKQTYTLISKTPSFSQTHTHTYQSTAFQVNPQPSTKLPTMAASDFSATGAPILYFTEYRGYRPKMGCVLQGRDQLYMSSCTLQGRGQLYMSSCSLMRN